MLEAAECRDAGCALRGEALPALAVRQLCRHAVQIHGCAPPQVRAVACALGEHLIDHGVIHRFCPTCRIRHCRRWQGAVEVRKARVVTEADELEMDTRVCEEMQFSTMKRAEVR